jgi:hypothetical protein
MVVRDCRCRGRMGRGSGDIRWGGDDAELTDESVSERARRGTAAEAGAWAWAGTAESPSRVPLCWPITWWGASVACSHAGVSTKPRMCVPDALQMLLDSVFNKGHDGRENVSHVRGAVLGTVTAGSKWQGA